MPNIFIDPFVFACPQPEEGLEKFRDYIDSIISWREFKEAGWASVYVTAKTPEILAETNSYPLWDDLKRAISSLEIRDIQAKDVVDLVNALLQKLPTIEDSFMFQEVLADEVTYNPSYHVSERLPVFVEHYERLIILLCLLIQFRQLEENDQILITRLLKEDRIHSEAKGIIHDCDCSEYLDPLEYPFEVASRFILCNTPNGMYLSVDPFTIWITARDVDDYYTAVNIYVYQVGHNSGQRLRFDELSWAFNPQFLQIAKDLGFLHEETKTKNLLRACAETVLGENLRAIHALRQGSGAEEPQKRRNEDRAWRRDIDYDYHLHYWETANGVEFASVVIHNDMTIPE